MKNLLFFFVSFISIQLAAQEVNFGVTISSDSVLIGNYIEVRFDIENVEGKFERPSFDGFEIVSGPSISSSISIINGEKTQKKAYSFYIKPLTEGRLFIGESYLTFGEEALETAPTEIYVYPNPDNIVENPTLDNFDTKFDFRFPNFGDFGGAQPPVPARPTKPIKKSKIKRRKI